MAPALCPRPLPALILLASLLAWPAAAAGSGQTFPARRPGGPCLSWTLELGPMAGLDSFLRGAEARAGLGLGWEGWGASLVTALAWDASLGSGRGLLGLGFDLGPDLALELGWEYGLGRARFTDAENGARVRLESAGLVSRLALSTRLAELCPLGGGRLGLRARLSWSSYRIAAIEGLPPATSASELAKDLAGREGFAAGFRASLSLSWSGPR